MSNYPYTLTFGAVTGVLYHVTPVQNVQGIELSGINPALSLGKLKVSWYVNRQNILWSIAHVSAEKNCTVNDLYVCAVEVEWKEMKHTARLGFYYTYAQYQIDSVSPAVMFIELDK